MSGFSRLGFRHWHIYNFVLLLHWAGGSGGGGNLFPPLDGVITWHRAKYIAQLSIFSRQCSRCEYTSRCHKLDRKMMSVYSMLSQRLVAKINVIHFLSLYGSVCCSLYA